MATAALMEENAVDAAVTDAARKVAEYEKVRDAFIEQIHGINLVNDCLRARREAKDAVARARRLGGTHASKTNDPTGRRQALQSGSSGRPRLRPPSGRSGVPPRCAG